MHLTLPYDFPRARKALDTRSVDLGHVGYNALFLLDGIVYVKVAREGWKQRLQNRNPNPRDMVTVLKIAEWFDASDSKHEWMECTAEIRAVSTTTVVEVIT